MYAIAAPFNETPTTDWASYIERHSDGNLTCGPAWLDLLRRVYGIESYALTATGTGGNITGVLLLSEIRSPFLGTRLVSLPFADHTPLLADDDQSARALLDQALAVAHTKRARYLELRTGLHGLPSEHSELTASALYVRWLVPLGDPEAAWAHLRKPVQRQVKKARNLGVTIRLADRREDMDLYHRLHLRTRCRKHGMPAQPRRFFQTLWDIFADQGAVQVLLAEHAGEAIAAMVFLGGGKTLRYAYGASDERFLQLGPNNLLLWTAIERAGAQGYQTLDLGRTALDNEGLMNFKRGWGAEQVPLPYYYYPHAQGLAVTSERSWKYRLATGTWKRLPLCVASPLGGALYKHLG
jgi:FemAB-related protein (PEP-CTERM system-associated)